MRPTPKASWSDDYIDEKLSIIKLRCISVFALLSYRLMNRPIKHITIYQ